MLEFLLKRHFSTDVSQEFYEIFKELFKRLLLAQYITKELSVTASHAAFPLKVFPHDF